MIKLKLDNKEVSFKWNSSMRLADFMKLNELSDLGIAKNLFELCQKAHAQSQFVAIDVSMVTRMKEEAFKVKGSFHKRVIVTADTGALKRDDAHLIDAYIEKRQIAHAKAVEAALIYKQTLDAKKQDDGQTENIVAGKGTGTK